MVLCAALLAPGSRLHAQATTAAPSTASGADYDNRWDLFGGFSYSYFSTGIGHALRTNLYGWGGQATAWVSPAFGLAGTVRSISGNIPLNPNDSGIKNPRISETLFLFGPDIRLARSAQWTMGVHGLVGGTYGIFDTDLKGIQPNSVGLPNNQLAFATAIGASFDYNLSPRLSIRGITDFQPTFFGTSSQKEFSGSVGVVYKVGSLRKK